MEFTENEIIEYFEYHTNRLVDHLIYEGKQFGFQLPLKAALCGSFCYAHAVFEDIDNFKQFVNHLIDTTWEDLNAQKKLNDTREIIFKGEAKQQ